MKQIKNRGYILFSIANSIFLAFQIAGFALSRDPKLQWSVPFCLILFFASVIPGTALGFFAAWFLGKRKDLQEEAIFAKYEDGWLVEGYRTLGEAPKDPAPPASIAWLIILVSYIPGFLAFYPGICAYDAYIQLNQIITGAWNDHHPILHTRLLGLFWQIGEKIGNPSTGIAIFTAFQLLCLSGAFAYCIHLIKKLHCGKVWYWVLTVFGAIFPYNMFMGMSVTKAGLFTAAFLPALVLLLYFFRKKREELSPEKEDIFYAILLVPAIAFRNNAKYAIGVFLVILFVLIIVLLIRKDRKYILYLRVFLTTLTGLLVAAMLMNYANKVWNVTPGDKREMLSIPVQQMARTVNYNLDEMLPRNMEIVDSFILDEGWRMYDPVISDPVKRTVNTWFAKNYPKQTLSTYFELLAKYPSDYIDAFLAQNAGYLYLFDRSCLTVYGDHPVGYGFVQTAWANDIYEDGIVKAPAIPALYEFLEKIASENTIQKIPVLGILFVPGYVLWAFIYLGLSCWYRKKYRLLLPVSLVVLFIGTLLLGPCVQLRYIYPVWVFLPFMAAVIYRKKNK